MKSALIVTSLISHPERIRKDLIEAPYDMIICCDAGLDRAFELGIVPDIIIGDFDSAEKMQIVIPDDDTAAPEVITLPHEKDMTDTEAACDLAYSRGAGVMTILGGIGGRFDHTMANIGLMSKYLGRADIFMLDGDNFIRMLAPGKIQRHICRLSVSRADSIRRTCFSLTLRLAPYYPLEDHYLTV